MKKLKIVIDILLFIATVLLFEIELIGNLNHEILGIALSILIIVHIALNFKWVKQVTKNLKNVKIKTKIMYVTNIFTLLIYLGAIACGILISDQLFKFHMSSNLYIVLAHLILGRLAISIMLVHLGLHLDRILAKIKSKKIKTIIYVFYAIMMVLVVSYLVYTLTHSFQWLYAFTSM